MFLLMSGIFFLLYTMPIEDGDLFWHLRTGRWIWEHRALPFSDPFSFTSQNVDSTSPAFSSIRFYLQQYWLGQLALFGIWNFFGSAGIVLLRAITYVCILLFLFLWMRRYSEGYFPLFLIFLTGNFLIEVPNERPQLFTFIFMPLTLFLIERAQIKEKTLSDKILLFLPLLMLIWANVHGGFIIGIGLILISLLSHIISAMLGRKKINPGLFFILLTSIAFSYINPNGYQAFKEFFLASPSNVSTILEYITPFDAAVRLNEYFPYYWIFVVICVCVIVIKIKELDMFHLLTLLSLTIFSFRGLRFMIFPLLASPLLTPYLKEKASGDIWRKVAAAILFIIWLFTVKWDNCLKFKTDKFFPEKAVRFLEAAKPAPEVFNYYDWGGYLMNGLPGYKVFIDGRGLLKETSDLYDKAMWSANWKDVFEHYKINTVVIPGVNKRTGATYPLAMNLIADGNWDLIYFDYASMVFIRHTALNIEVAGKYSIPKREGYRHILMMLNRLPSNVSARADYWISRGNASYLSGDYQAASASFSKASYIDPGNEWVKEIRRRIENK